MIANPFLLISTLISTLIAFTTMVVLVESVLVLAGVQKARLKAYLRILPFISLAFDAMLSTLSIGYWLNPLNCSSCVQKLLLTLFFPDLKEYLYSNEISLLNYLGLGISHALFGVAYILFWFITLYFVVRLLFDLFLVIKELQFMTMNEALSLRPVGNVLLAKALYKNNVKIFSSSTLAIPMATYSKTIFIPHQMILKLSQGEYEAVVAHELEHIIWKDPLLRVFIQMISALFWWVPTSSWQRKLEFDQEVACDQSLLKYDLKEEYLASVLVKASSSKKLFETLCYLSQKKHSSLRRIQLLLCPDASPSKWASWCGVTVALIGSLVAGICVIWS